MKKIQLFLLLFFISSIVLAQHSAYKPTGEKYRRMIDSKVKAVITGNPNFDTLFSKYVKEVFSKKQVDFITYSEFDEERTYTDYSFIVPVELVVTYTYEDPLKKDREDRSFMLAYYPGTKKKILAKDFNPSNFISYVSFDPSLPEDYLNSSLYRLKNMVQEIYQTIEILEKTGENKFFLKPSIYLKDVYNSKSKSIKEKELIVCSDAISIPERDFKKVYPYKFKILDRESYKKEIALNKEGQCYLLMKSYIVEVFVVDSKTGEIILETGFRPEMRKVIANRLAMQQLDAKQLSEIVKMTK
ncbi:MAG: hypothetical protein K9I48_02465 [Sphingobacteriales bacterium]|nr:hypothetical protein [Sphingobacteriales bacterium]